MKTNAGEIVQTVLRKLGVKDTEQFQETLDKLKEYELAEEIEGDIRQRVEGLATAEDFKKNPKLRSELKAEFLNGLEKDGLGDFVNLLDEIDKAEYQRKDGATNKIKHLIEATAKTKAKQNAPNLAEEENLRKKILEMEAKITNGEYVPKAQIEALTSKINALHEGSFKDKIISKLSPKVVEHLNDVDFLNLKTDKFMKDKGLIYNYEEGRFYKKKGDDLILATKHDKTVEPMGMDDLIEGILSSDEKLVKKSDMVPSGQVVIPAKEVPKVDGIFEGLAAKAEAHKAQLGK